MLDEYLNRNDVSLFIDRIYNNARYYCKDIDESLMYFATEKDIALFTFYDALFKYKVIVDDIYLFDEYLDNLDKLYKRIDNYDDMSIGINKLICKTVATKLNIKDIDSELSKKEIVSFIFNKYILDGYYIHGFNSIHKNEVAGNCFMPEVYNNLYSRMIDINTIFSEYGAENIINKDFNNKNISYTDSIAMGSYYSLFSPLYFYNLLLNNDYFKEKIKKDISIINDYSFCTKNIKKFMDTKKLKDKEKEYIMSIIKKEWNILHEKERKITLLLVKKNTVEITESNISDFLDQDSTIYEIVDRMLSSKRSNVTSDVCLYDNYEVLTLDYKNTYEDVSEVTTTYKELDEEEDKKPKFGLINAYGSASIIMIIGSLLISLGVIMTLFMVLGGSK